VVFAQGDTKVALVYVRRDRPVGLGDIDTIRNDPRVAAAGVDHVIVGSIHAHDAVDTIGLWGPQALVSGYNPAFNARLNDAAARAVVDAAAAAVPAQLVIAKTLLLNTPGDPQSRTDHWNKDIRDPVIFDPTLTVARFVRADSPTTTIATVVNWADHPEMSAFGANNLLVSAHYVHYLRDKLEQGVGAPWLDPIAGIGGITVFVQGALGGQIGSIRNAPVPGPDGTPITESGHPKEEALGTNLARRSLEILRDDGETVTRSCRCRIGPRASTPRSTTPASRWRSSSASWPRTRWSATTRRSRWTPGNEPWIPMRATYLQVGPLAIITCPGELHPELWVGGYDGSWSWGWPIMDTDQAQHARPADRADGAVPARRGAGQPRRPLPGAGRPGDGLRRLHRAEATTTCCHANSPYLEEADGDHYEETYSLGPEVEAPRGPSRCCELAGVAAVTGAPAGPAVVYKFVEVAPVTAETLEEAVNARGRRRLGVRRHPLRR
jgi:hypothetical protein